MKKMRGNITTAVLILLLIHSAANAFNLPDTGQITCYDSAGTVISCAGAGQNGEFSINSMSYTDNGNGTVTDNNTGLMWQKCSAGQNNDSTCTGQATTFNWDQAAIICGSLNLGGHTGDWRLPSKKELMSIVDYSIPYNSSPTIQTAYFPNTLAGPSYYWSSTVSAYDVNSVWNVLFFYGYVNFTSKPSADYVRCVRGGQVDQRLVGNNDGTVTDNSTGLMWQKCIAGQTNDVNCSGNALTYNWTQALSYCKGLQLGDKSDWRLPNIKELASLTNDTQDNPSIDITMFPNAYASSYWSSTTSASFPSFAWLVDFHYGYVYGYGYGFNKTEANYVRCVRGGQSGSFVRLIRGVNLVNTFKNIQDAYNQALTGDIIQAQAVVATENQTFVAYKAVSLKCGYDGGFVTNTGTFTRVKGNLTISGGTVTVENLIIE